MSPSAYEALNDSAFNDVNWNAASQVRLLCSFIDQHSLGGELYAFLLDQAEEEDPGDDEDWDGEDEEDDEGVGYLDPAGDGSYDSDYEDE